ncbi:glycosyltransferase [Candidatus Kirkpatrickella diaphorinae]|uniref:Glycosyltransferase n=1 Tax=Candidatus Kirkpatrickella diaphorinae TaxID=2984322 RepID=A0ABY6GKL5_9PROT|nr:glycosyltransferase [Candidatus Kirkpatrickella diaphorinae]UYH52076.1 glycosyltransferase [Candidatus Kirkpatrickella diaphorinae]
MTSPPLPRIAHIMAGAARGGAELFFERLSVAQHRQGYPVTTFIRPDGARAARLEAGHVAITQLRFHRHLTFLTRRHLKKCLTTYRPDIAIAWMNRATRATPRGPWALVGRLGGYYDLRNYRHCDALIGNTRGLVTWMTQKGWPQDKVFYLPNFARDFSDVTPQRPNFIPANVPFLLAMGRLHPNKGFDVLIRALQDVPRAHLVIAGEGPARDALQDVARQCGVTSRVHLPGWLTDTGPFLRACDIFICSSRIEPLGNIVIEAMSAGRPVIAGNIQGPAEILHGTEDGMLAESENPHDFSLKINNLLGDPDKAHALSVKGRQRYEREFSAPTVLAQWDRFFQQMRFR